MSLAKFLFWHKIIYLDRTSIAFVSTKCSRAEAQTHLTTEKEKICFVMDYIPKNGH